MKFTRTQVQILLATRKRCDSLDDVEDLRQKIENKGTTIAVCKMILMETVRYYGRWKKNPRGSLVKLSTGRKPTSKEDSAYPELDIDASWSIDIQEMMKRPIGEVMNTIAGGYEDQSSAYKSAFESLSYLIRHLMERHFEEEERREAEENAVEDENEEVNVEEENVEEGEENNMEGGGSPGITNVRGKRAVSTGKRTSNAQGRTKSRRLSTLQRTSNAQEPTQSTEFITDADGVKRPASKSIPRKRKMRRITEDYDDDAEADGAEDDGAEDDDGVEADGAEADVTDVEDDGTARTLFR